MHARVVEPFGPHVHDEFAVGVCTEGTQLIRYRGGLYHAGPGSVVILEPGVPPYAWLAQYRVARARALLDRGHRPAQAAALAGFADQAHLTRWFRRVVGVTPGTYCNSVQDRPPAAPA
jgi:AraC-like DNA-binding protein